MFPRFCFWHLLLKDERAVQLIGLSAGAAPLCHPSSGGHRLKKATAINDVAKEAEAAVHLRGRPLVADARPAGRDQLVDPFAALCSPRRDGPGPRAISVRSLKRPPGIPAAGRSASLGHRAINTTCEEARLSRPAEARGAVNKDRKILAKFGPRILIME